MGKFLLSAFTKPSSTLILDIQTCVLLARNPKDWSRSRDIVHPIFKFSNLKSFISIFHEESLKLVQAFEKFAMTGDSCCPNSILCRFTTCSVSRNILNVSPEDEILDKTEEFLKESFQHFQNRMLMPLYKNSFLYWLVGLKQKEDKMMEEVQSIFQYQQAMHPSAKKGPLFSQALIENATQNELFMNAMILLGAATDTTKTTMFSMLLMLALHPSVQSNVYEEVISVLGKDINIAPAYEDLKKLLYVERVIKECLRMYPAAPIIAKEVPHDMKIQAADQEYTLPKGTIVPILIQAIHNSSFYYEKPQVFDPDRWLPENVAQRDPHCFLPFSNGPRKCVGGKYAMLQVATLTATIIRTFEILPAEHCRAMEDVGVSITGLLTFSDNCRFKIKKR